VAARAAAVAADAAELDADQGVTVVPVRALPARVPVAPVPRPATPRLRQRALLLLVVVADVVATARRVSDLNKFQIADVRLQINFRLQIVGLSL
jgi:hypothetical protein